MCRAQDFPDTDLPDALLGGIGGQPEQPDTGNEDGQDREYREYLLNSLFGTKFKAIIGYPDSGAIGIAMERGELQGYCSFTLAAITMQDFAMRPSISTVQAPQSPP